MTTTTKITVTGCGDCPFKYYIPCDGEFCGLAENKNLPESEIPIDVDNTPSWCPLKNNNVVVVEMKTENKV